MISTINGISISDNKDPTLHPLSILNTGGALIVDSFRKFNKVFFTL